MIPELHDGVLPDGIYECSIDEIAKVFGCSRRSERRHRLTDKLREYLQDARRSGIVTAVIIDGSYVTGKDEPNDIDMIVVLRADFDLAQELRPFEYNVQSRRMIRNQYRFDAKIAIDGTQLLQDSIAFFCQIRTDDPEQPKEQARKGLLKVVP